MAGFLVKFPSLKFLEFLVLDTWDSQLKCWGAWSLADLCGCLADLWCEHPSWLSKFCSSMREGHAVRFLHRGLLLPPQLDDRELSIVRGPFLHRVEVGWTILISLWQNAVTELHRILHRPCMSKRIVRLAAQVVKRCDVVKQPETTMRFFLHSWGQTFRSLS